MSAPGRACGHARRCFSPLVFRARALPATNASGRVDFSAGSHGRTSAMPRRSVRGRVVIPATRGDTVHLQDVKQPVPWLIPDRLPRDAAYPMSARLTFPTCRPPAQESAGRSATADCLECRPLGRHRPGAGSGRRPLRARNSGGQRRALWGRLRVNYTVTETAYCHRNSHRNSDGSRGWCVPQCNHVGCHLVPTQCPRL